MMSKQLNDQKSDVVTSASNDDNSSDIIIDPAINAAIVVKNYTKQINDGGTIENLFRALNKVIRKATKDNSLTHCEAMLLSQAQALQAIFMNLTTSAVETKMLKQFEIYLKLGLKAQSQCRATLETLAALKNPPIVFAKQANIAQGHQQVNNNLDVTMTVSRAQKNNLDQNELLGDGDEKRLDSRETTATSGINPAMETLEPVYRPDNR